MVQRILKKVAKVVFYLKSPICFFFPFCDCRDSFYSKQGMNLYRELSGNQSDEYYNIYYDNLTKI